MQASSSVSMKGRTIFFVHKQQFAVVWMDQGDFNLDSHKNVKHHCCTGMIRQYRKANNIVLVVGYNILNMLNWTLLPFTLDSADYMQGDKPNKLLHSIIVGIEYR